MVPDGHHIEVDSVGQRLPVYASCPDGHPASGCLAVQHQATVQIVDLNRQAGYRPESLICLLIGPIAQLAHVPE